MRDSNNLPPPPPSIGWVSCNVSVIIHFFLKTNLFLVFIVPYLFCRWQCVVRSIYFRLIHLITIFFSILLPNTIMQVFKLFSFLIVSVIFEKKIANIKIKKEVIKIWIKDLKFEQKILQDIHQIGSYEQVLYQKQELNSKVSMLI